ncbi:putative 2OG-Fe(II) oxygenase [Sphingomonas silueang]|uniref:putative 2OG-Fe(II) oxygenase n=1 Tax=Sphingomonas silueang TaxID=3156617 RepID=UPI0032B3B7FB
MSDAATMRAAALAAAKRGDDAGAERLFAQALAAFPRDAALANSAGNFHAGAGRAAEALALFDRALAIDPRLGEAAINRAVMLTRLGRAGEAVAELTAGQAALAALPRYWTTRAAAETAIGDLRAAADSYAAQLARDPRHVRALHGAARTALDRGAEDAVAQYDRALRVSPGDPWLLHGLAQALEAAGDRPAALGIAADLALHLPQWVDALELYAGLRWAAGEREGFCDHYPRAVAVHPDGAAERSWAAMLAGVDRHADAGEVLAAARRRVGDRDELVLAEAIARGEAGEDGAAAALFDRFGGDTPDWQVARARQALRTGAPDLAERLLAAALAVRADDVTAWSLRDLAWRVLGDARHEWLHRHPALIRELPLDLSAAQRAAACTTLDALHDRAAMPIGQSVKQGSQTRGALFQRDAPMIRAIARAVDEAIARYREGLPPVDPVHPLLARRDAPWRVVGSWSIRLDGRGRHAPHVHPHGLLSSAAYFTVPEAAPGVLELGRAPENLRLDLPPIATIVPRVGHCVLFPSTLFHGTRPIAAGRRMTVAFDVA